MGGGGWASKGAAITDNWWQAAANLSPSIPVEIHDATFPDPGPVMLTLRPDDHFDKLCADIKRGFDDATKFRK